MLGIKQIQEFPYAEVDGSHKTGDVFFFGNPCEFPDLVYAQPFVQLGIPDTCKAANMYNKDKIIELTDLKSLLIKNVKMRDNLGTLKANHPLQQKIEFIKELIEETALTYLKYINRLMWVDRKYFSEPKGQELTRFQAAVKLGDNYRWQETGISFDTAVEFCRAMTKELTSFFSLMIDLRYYADLLHNKLESDFYELVNKYRVKSGKVAWNLRNIIIKKNGNNDYLKKVDEDNIDLMFKEVLKYNEELRLLWQRGEIFEANVLLSRYQKTKEFYKILCKFILEITSLFYYTNFWKKDQALHNYKNHIFCPESKGLEFSFDKAFGFAMQLEKTIKAEFTKILDILYPPITEKAIVSAVLGKGEAEKEIDKELYKGKSKKKHKSKKHYKKKSRKHTEAEEVKAV